MVVQSEQIYAPRVIIQTQSVLIYAGFAKLLQLLC